MLLASFEVLQETPFDFQAVGDSLKFRGNIFVERCYWLPLKFCRRRLSTSRLWGTPCSTRTSSQLISWFEPLLEEGLPLNGTCPSPPWGGGAWYLSNGPPHSHHLSWRCAWS